MLAPYKLSDIENIQHIVVGNIDVETLLNSQNIRLISYYIKNIHKVYYLSYGTLSNVQISSNKLTKCSDILKYLEYQPNKYFKWLFYIRIFCK